MIINIKPVDVLFFRDSKPFGRGSEHFANSIFPPYPQTLYGALRTKVLEELECDFESFKNGELKIKKDVSQEQIEKIKEEVGAVEKPGTFTLKGPLLLFANDTIYLKIPYDIKIYNENSVVILKPFEWKDFFITDLDINLFSHIPTDKPLEDLEGFISLRDFVDCYLLGKRELQKKDIKENNSIFSYEIRTGIQINNRGTTEEGKLYTIQYIRLEDNWSFYGEVDNLSFLPEKGFIKFGGGRRVCYYEKMDNNPFSFCYNEQIVQNIKNRINQTKQFKLIFLTPTIFKNGWLSEKIKLENSQYILSVDNVKAKLLTAAIGKPEYISGWDIANKRPKPLKKLVPSGSVYYFELLEGTVDELFNIFNFKNFSDENPNLGFGLTLIGGV